MHILMVASENDAHLILADRIYLKLISTPG